MISPPSRNGGPTGAFWLMAARAEVSFPACGGHHLNLKRSSCLRLLAALTCRTPARSGAGVTAGVQQEAPRRQQNGWTRESPEVVSHLALARDPKSMARVVEAPAPPRRLARGKSSCFAGEGSLTPTRR